MHTQTEHSPDVVNAHGQPAAQPAPVQQQQEQPAFVPGTKEEMSRDELEIVGALGLTLDEVPVDRLRAIAANLKPEQAAKLLKAAHAVRAPTWGDVPMLGTRQDIRTARTGMSGSLVAAQNVGAKGYSLYRLGKWIFRKVF